jgi:glucose/arabinose dehydrogenase
VAGIGYPLAMAVRPSDGSVWIARKGGAICKLTGGSCSDKRTIAVSGGNEQGLLGLTFSPSGSTLFSSYTNPAGDTRLARHTMSGDSVGPPAEFFALDQPYANHNGGNIAIGPDGRLWLGLGDGGSGGDPQNHAQTSGDPLGKFLRFHPSLGGYDIVIAGVRNPWRWSFDRSTGDLWIGDVGQNAWEEVDFLAAGQQIGRNLGWSRFEGTHIYNPNRTAPGAVFPIHEYAQGPGCSVTGGYVYRGGRIPALRGAYLFADYCDGTIRAMKQAGGRRTALRSLGVNPGNVTSFGQDAGGELYVLTPDTLYRIDPA